MPKQDRNGGKLDLFEFLNELDDPTDATGMTQMLRRIAERYGLRSVAYLGSGVAGEPGQDPYLAVTYSQEWVDHYKESGFVDVDPAIQVGLRRLLPIDWDQFVREGEKVRRLFGEASEFGLGHRGISFPVHGRQGDRALLSITSDAGDKDWQRLRLDYLRDFQVLALHLHQAVLRIAGHQSKEHVRISPRERECLRWIAEGKTYWETAMILGLSEHTVRCYLESARHKLGAANNSHAVNKAGKASLLSQLP